MCQKSRSLQYSWARVLFPCWEVFFCPNEQVFGCVFRVDKFCDVCSVTQDAQDLCAASVGENVGGSAVEYAVCPNGGKYRCVEL